MTDLVLLDSGVIIDVIQKKEGVHEHLKPLFRQAVDGELYVLVSSVSRAEVLCLKDFAATGLSQEDQNELIKKWFNNDYIVERAADRIVGERAAELRRDVAKTYRKEILTTADSLILATAVEMDAHTVITLDEGKGARANNKKKAIGLTKLNGFWGDSFPEIVLPKDFKCQTEFPYDEQE